MLFSTFTVKLDFSSFLLMTCLTFVDVFWLNLYTLLVWKPICSKMPREKIKLRAVIMPFGYLKQAYYIMLFPKGVIMRSVFVCLFFLFVCLGFIVPLDNFSLIWRRHHYSLQILIYAWHSWPLSSECSLACHTYCDMGHPFIMGFSMDPGHSHLLPSV